MNTNNKIKTPAKDSFEPAEIKVLAFETNDIILTSPDDPLIPVI